MHCVIKDIMFQTTENEMTFPLGYSARRAERDAERARMDAMERECYLAELETNAFAKGFAIGYAEGREKARSECFRAMLRNRYSVEEIARMLDLSCCEVREALRYAGRRIQGP